MIFGTKWCASNRPVCLSERSGYLLCAFRPVPYTAKCIGEWSRVNRQGILYQLGSVVIRSSLLSILTQFLLHRSQKVMVDGCQSKPVNVVSWMPQGRVLGPLFFLLYTYELFSILENKLIGSADDSTLMAIVPSPGIRVTVAVPDPWPRQG